MHIHLRIQRWVIWWFYLGVICGAIALVNILGHHLTPAQDALFLIVGAAHWLLGGIVCWAFESIKVQPKRPSAPVPVLPEQSTAFESEWHPASDFLLPGRKSILLPRRR